MSTMEHTSTSTVGKIPIGRRIQELMQELGDAFSIRAFSERLGINRETFRTILTGERPITLPELEKVTLGLRVTEERLRQLDTLKKEQDLNVILNASERTKMMLIRAHTIATELVKVAKGYTERGFALNYLGRVHYLQRNYDEAHKAWLKSLEFSKLIQVKFNDISLLNVVSTNIMLTYIMRKEYSNVDELLTLVEQTFPNDVESLGMTSYTRMNLANEQGNLELAAKWANRSLEYFKQTGNNRQIALSMINVAHFEYLTGNYPASAKILLEVIELSKSNESILIVAIKDYVKSLIKIGDLHSAEQLIAEYEIMSLEYPDYWGKLQILNTVVKDDPSFAVRVCSDPKVSLEVRKYAYNCLFEFYTLKDDYETAIGYYKKGEIVSGKPNTFITKEGF